MSRFEGGSFTPIPLANPISHVQRLHRDRIGRLWISTGGTGLVRVSDVGIKAFRVADGLPSDFVYGIVEQADGAFWVATRGGLAKLVGDTVTGFANVLGAPARSPVHVHIDGLGFLWVTANDGVYRLSLEELDRVTRNKGGPLASQVFTVRDGLRSTEMSWRCSGQAVLGDGRIYYATARGLALLDPRKISENTTLPVVSIESVTSGGVPLLRDGAASSATISDRHALIEIRYTSPELVTPDRLEFRVRLVGYDRDWSLVRGNRTVQYANLPPGEYVFRVSARRHGGRWGETAQSGALRIPARWHETGGARLLAALALALAAYAGYLLLLLRSKRIERLLTLKVAERTNELRLQVTERELAESRSKELADRLEIRVRERTAELQLANLATRASEERYALAVRGAEDGLWDWDLTNGILYLSPRWKDMLGYGDTELASSFDVWLAHVHPEDRAGFHVALTLTPGHSGQIRHEYRMVTGQGNELWVICRGVVVFDELGNPLRAAGSQTDITLRKRTEAEQLRNATHDQLTGLPNRSLFADRLAQTILNAGGLKRPFAVLLVDIDHFHTVNEGLGRTAGDKLLVEIAERWRHAIRHIDTLARLGGDQFAVLLPEVPTHGYAIEVAERLQGLAAEPLAIESERLEVAVSIGVKHSTADAQNFEELLRDADLAMLQAKAEGRGRHHVFDAQLRRRTDDRLRMEAGLRRALSEDEFVLHYQPLVSLASGAVLSVEALIRWQHPERGLIAPTQFVAVAEASGLMIPLSAWVLDAACAQAKRWQGQLERPVRIAINLPPVCLNDPELAAQIGRALVRHQLQPSALCIEIVESSVLETHASVLENLNQLRVMGVQIAIDDFGTGYSSFSYLKQLPINYLKIDRSFTHRIPSDPTDTAICNALLSMAAQLRLGAVVEGIETKEQADYLRAAGCKVGQGYYFSKPLPAAECTRFIRQNQIRISSDPALSPTLPAL